jgi:uncharacterized membrane protein
VLTVTTWTVILSVALGTYALRLSMLVLLAGRPISPRVHRAVGLVAPAALSGLVSMMLIGDGAAADPAQMVAVIAGFITVRRTQDVLHAFVVGLPLFAAATFLL